MNLSLKLIPILLLLNYSFSFACSDLEIPYEVEKSWSVGSGEKNAPEFYVVILPVSHGGLHFSSMSLRTKGMLIPIATKLTEDGNHVLTNIGLSTNALENITVEAGYNFASNKNEASPSCEKYQEITFGI
jgi:hypothetical protein